MRHLGNHGFIAAAWNSDQPPILISGRPLKSMNQYYNKRKARLQEEAKIEPDVKEQAEGILATLGIPASNAINMFYKQIILNRGLPFEVKIPTARPVEISRMNAETFGHGT